MPAELDRLRWKKFSYSIANGVTQFIYQRGTVVTVLTAPSSGLFIAFDDQEESEIPQGITLDMNEFIPFEKFYLRNGSGSTQTVEVAVAEGKIIDNRFNVSGAILTKSGTAISTPASATTAAAVAQNDIAANASRNTILIQNQSTTENLWVGDANVGNDAAPRGLKVLAGDSIVIDASSAVWVRRGNATNITYTWMEIS